MEKLFKTMKKLPEGTENQTWHLCCWSWNLGQPITIQTLYGKCKEQRHCWHYAHSSSFSTQKKHSPNHQAWSPRRSKV